MELVNAFPQNETLNKIVDLTDLEDEYTIAVNAARWAINHVVTPILCIFGVVGNIMNIIVLRRCGYKDTNVLLLVSLSLADLLLSLIHSFRHVHFIIERYDLVTAALVGTFSFVYLFASYQITLCVVQCHLVSIATERVIAVYYPFHVVRIFSRSSVLVIIVCMYVLCIVINLPVALIFDVGSMYVPGLNQTIYVVAPSQIFSDNYESMESYNTLGLGIFNAGLLPISIIIGSSLVGIKLLLRKRQPLSKVKKSDSNDLKGMRLLLAVCVTSYWWTSRL